MQTARRLPVPVSWPGRPPFTSSTRTPLLHNDGMTTTVGHTEAQLLKRNELLEALRDMDYRLRDLHKGPWRTDQALASEIRHLGDQREELCREVAEMGASPWCFNIKHDNSWIAAPHGG